MCGIVGIISKGKAGLYKGQIDVFTQLLFVDQLRGTDGTGLFFNDSKGINVVKMPVPAGKLIASDVYIKAMEVAVREGHFLVGHNRAATKGNIVWKDTHPFTEGSITLIHNGTLFDHKELDKEATVDSHAICKHMAANGYEKTLKEIDGAFALVWVDDKLGTVNLCRNLQRPLHLLETAVAWIIVSEEKMGQWIADRNNVHVTSSILLSNETVYTFQYSDFSKYETKEVEYHSWYSGKGYITKGNNLVQLNGNKKTQTPATTIGKVYKKNGSYVDFIPKTTEPTNCFSCLIWDDNREQLFLLGEMVADKGNEIRVYGDYKFLSLFVNKPCLTGVVSSCIIKGQKTIYTVVSVRETKEIVTEHCALCAIELTDKDKVKHEGAYICPECKEILKDHPHNYYEIGGHC